ncbi:hypothetical protein swp_2452 [Shewanella piezotolerans WP3]|uniref:Six-hairpin glycosidase-like protein n=1 Tax=Shewanella piezotolerans (strain WP3 / JCM 13877) TaxID=225849 RepID=B8CMD8_SHEPW|nr:hypothetical protein [Shewanella piezotolerans]ACJ29195.1 hypothetical protein swp_2452 [Shewanella piezotolerans WP3]
MLKKLICSLVVAGCCHNLVFAKESDVIGDLADTLDNRWQLGQDRISWQVKDSHEDHLEFSGEKMSAIIYYGSDTAGNLSLKRKLVWPMLRTIPNDTHASLIHDFPLEISPKWTINGDASVAENLVNVEFDGVLTLTSTLGQNIILERTLSPSTNLPVLVERLKFSNNGTKNIDLELTELDYSFNTKKSNGVYGVYHIQAQSEESGSFTLTPNQSVIVNAKYMATKQGQEYDVSVDKEINKRQRYIEGLTGNLQLVTPDPIVNQMFNFSKIRAAESIYRTKGGLMHGPGGGRYYAAIWANDQAEYINPFFPYLGNANGNESAINSYEHFARFMNPEYTAIPSSIIAEGIDIWNGAGDRGDCAMIAYGASRFALANGDEKDAKSLLPLIDWCIEFSYRQMSKEGVIASDSDELEGRFPSGQYNLSTNMLTYGALVSSVHLNNELGRKDVAKGYAQRAIQLRSSIERYFGANVQGFETYRYFEGNEKLRAWIALPLTMGIFDRKQGTLDALLSDKLWSADGIYSEAGNNTFWDRATLYAFRGIFAAGETDTAMRYFKYYSRKRLLGEHVPYAVEAWPEGNQRHLSAESALYGRVVTEGIFGIEATGFKQFSVAPFLPSSWNEMCLNNVRAFRDNFDVCVSRKGEAFEVAIKPENKPVMRLPWQGKAAISVNL